MRAVSHKHGRVTSRLLRVGGLLGALALAAAAMTAAAARDPVSSSAGLPGPTELRVSFRSGANTLSGILSVPAGGGRHAAIVILSGSERGGTTFTTHVEHARVLARSGYAVLRYDPPGVGRSTGSLRLETLDGRAREAIAAVDYLRSRPEVRPGEIGLWGGSQGAWVAQMAAARSRHVAFVISAAGSGVSAAEQQVYSVEAQSRAAGFSRPAIAKAGLFARLLVDWQLTKPVYRRECRAQLQQLGSGPWSTFAALVYSPGSLTPAQGLRRGIAILKSIRNEPWARYLSLDTAVLPALEAIPPAQVAAAKAAAQQSLLAEPKAYLTAVHCPVLALWGEDDTVVPAQRSASLYRQYLRAAGNRDVTIVLFPNAGHSLNTPAYWPAITRWLDHRFGK